MTVTPWVRCEACRKVVKVNKPLLGSLHLCATIEVVAWRDPEYARQLQAERRLRRAKSR